jgi:hypothetical protein
VRTEKSESGGSERGTILKMGRVQEKHFFSPVVNVHTQSQLIFLAKVRLTYGIRGKVPVLN